MSPHIRLFPLAAVLILLTHPVSGATIDVDMGTGQVLWGGTANSGIFWNNDPGGTPQTIGGVTTDIDSGNLFDDVGPTPGGSSSVTYFSVDSATKAEFSFDVIVSGYQNNNGTITQVGVNDTGCCSAGVDSTFGGEDRGQIESAAFLGGNQSEFLRVSVENVTVTNPGSLTGDLEFAGFFGATIRTQDGQGDIGNVLEAGVGDVLGTNVLASWDDSAFRQFLLFDPTLAIDVAPTADRAALQGLQLRFEEVQRVVPEPTSVGLWGLLIGTAVLTRGRWQKR